MIDLKKPEKCVVAMVHVGALPGTPGYQGNISSIIDKAISDANLYLRCGVDAILMENMHDVPYLKTHVGPEIVASMSVVSNEIRRLTKIPLGVQVLAGANREAIAVALAANLDFIRSEGFVFGHLADEGFFESCAGELLRYRKQIGAEHIAIFTDVKKKHASHFITSDINLSETIRTAEYFRSDGIIITGKSTGAMALVEEVVIAAKSTTLPVLVGSGITANNVEAYWEHADAFIVGSYFKKRGDWKNEVDEARVINFMNQIHMLRTNK
jgi:uncharacterized protein